MLGFTVGLGTARLSINVIFFNILNYYNISQLLPSVTEHRARIVSSHGCVRGGLSVDSGLVAPLNHAATFNSLPSTHLPPVSLTPARLAAVYELKMNAREFLSTVTQNFLWRFRLNPQAVPARLCAVSVFDKQATPQKRQSPLHPNPLHLPSAETHTVRRPAAAKVCRLFGRLCGRNRKQRENTSIKRPRRTFSRANVWVNNLQLAERLAKKRVSCSWEAEKVRDTWKTEP